MFSRLRRCRGTGRLTKENTSVYGYDAADQLTTNGATLAGAGAAFVAALAAATFLQRWFKTRTLTSFAIYGFAAGVLSIVRFP